MASDPQFFISRRKVLDENDVYPIYSGKIGPCLIINNVNFDYLSRRLGSEKDAERFNNIFRGLGFHVIRTEDLTIEEMKCAIKEAASNERNKNSSAFVLIILSHGLEGKICGTDSPPDPGTSNLYLGYKDIVKLLNNRDCKSLKTKPKICFFQACSGSKMSVLQDDCSSKKIRMDKKPRLPEISDILMSFAAQDEYTTLRNTVTGGIYSCTLADVLERYSRTCHLMEILTVLERRLRDVEISLHGVDICLSTSLKLIGWSRKFFFHPIENQSVSEDGATAQPLTAEDNNYMEDAVPDVESPRKLWVQGGNQAPEYLSLDGSVWILTDGTELTSWTTENRTKQVTKFGQGVVSCQSYLWFFGGKNGNTVCSDVERFCTSNPEVEKMPPMPTARENLSVTFFAGKFYAIGGSDENGGNLDVVEIFDPSTNLWSVGPSLNQARSGHTSFALE